MLVLDYDNPVCRQCVEILDIKKVNQRLENTIE